MNVTETSADGLKREFKITIPASQIEERIAKRLDEIGRIARIPGFRPGKVPIPLLRKRFGPSVRGEVIESAVQDSTAEAVREHSLRPALPPRYEIVSADEGADFEYKLSLEILPDMPELDFSNLGLEKLMAEAPDEEIDKALQRLAESQRKSEPVERPAESGDIIVADVVGRADGTEIPGSRGEGRQIELGGEGLLPGFTEQLTGIGAGETREVRVTFPEDYGNPELAGKEGVFEVAAKEVRHRLPPVIDDSLAEALALENLNELRQEIRQRMQRDYDAMARQKLKRALLDKLAERYDFPVPPGMVEMEFNSIWGQYQGEREARRQMEAARNTAAPGGAEGPIDAAAVIAPEETALEGASERAPAGAEAETIEPRPAPANPAAHEVAWGENRATSPLGAAAIVAPEETALEGAADAEPPVPDGGAEPGQEPDKEPDQEKARERFRTIAERRVRLGLLLAEVGRSNNISVSQEELNQALVQEARRHPGYERQVVDYYRNNPDALNNLRAPIFEEKVVDFIVELAKPEERTVTPQELMTASAEDDEEESAPA